MVRGTRTKEIGDQLWGVYHKGVVVIKGTKKEIEAFAEKLKGMTDEVAEKYLDDLVETELIQSLLKKFPSINEFEKWFDEFNFINFEMIWKNSEIKSKIASRIRYPGGMHEWLLVARANVFKRWGVSMKEIKSLTSKIESVVFKNPPGRHGGFGSTKAHNELLKLIDESEDFIDFKKKLITWAEERLEGGANNLPKGLLK